MNSFTNNPAKRTLGSSVSELMDSLRSSGMDVRGQGSPLVAWVAAWLFLQWAEHEDRERQAVAEFDGEDYEPLFSKRDLVERCFDRDEPENIGWNVQELLLRELYREGDNSLRKRVEQVFRPELIEGPFRPMFMSDEVWRWMADWIVPLNFSEPGHAYAASLLLDTLLSLTMERTHATEFYTPEPVAELMVELAAPKPGDRIYDPCFGTGGLLVESAKRTREAAKTCAAGEWERLRRQTIFGVELNPLVYTIAMTRIVLAGITEPGLELGDSLERPRNSAPERFDVVLACPPWGYGGKVQKGEQFRYDHLPIRSRDLTNLFVQHAMQALRPGGRAVIAVPEGTLFGTGADKKLREYLLEEFHVDGVVSLPAGTFAPFTGIKSNLLVFRRAKPAEQVRFLTVKRLAGSQGKSLKIDEEPKAIAGRFASSEFDERFWATSVGDLRKRDFELVAKRTGEDQLQKWLGAIRKSSPEIEMRSLSDVSKVTAGVSYDRRSVHEDARDPDAVGLVRVSDVREGRVVEPELFVTAEGLARVKDTQLLRHGDVLLSVSGTIGKIGVASFEGEAPNWAAAKNLVIVRPTDERVLPGYLAAILGSPAYQEWMSGHARGSAIQHLSIRTVRHLEVPVPELLMQERVAKEWQSNRASDALMHLSRFLTSGDVARSRAFERSAQAESLVVIADETSRRDDPLYTLDRLAGTIARFDLEEDPEGLIPWWDAWVHGIKTALGPLVGVNDVQPSPALYALLQDGRNRLDGVDRSLPKPSQVASNEAEEQLLRQARKFLDAAKSCAERALRVLTGGVSLKFGLADATVVVGEAQELTVRLDNASPLPLRNVSVNTRPPVGQTTIKYLPEASSVEFTISIPAAQNPGKSEFTVVWHAMAMDGSQLRGDATLAVEATPTREAVHQADLGASPYITGDPVYPGRQEMFIGRQGLIDKIKRQLSNTRGGNTILLEGNRRTGKTSILYHLISDEVLPGWLPVYCSFQGGTGDAKQTGLPTAQVFRTIARAVFDAALKVGVRTWIPGSTPPSGSDIALKAGFLRESQTAITEDTPFETFELYLQSAVEALSPRRLLLMLDEFDKLQDGIEHGVTSPQVPENLRYLLHRMPNLAAIFSYSKQLRSLREHYWSALFGLGYPVSVGSLSLQDARILVTRPVQGRLVYSDDARDRVCELCACQPFLIQNLCNRVFEAAAESRQRTATLSMVEAAAEAMAGDNEHFHFATLWKDEVTSERQRYILSLCQQLEGGPDATTLKLIEIKLEEASVQVRGSKQLGEDLRTLRDLDLLNMHSNGSRYALAVPLMAMWIQKNIDVEDQRRRAVQEGQD